MSAFNLRNKVPALASALALGLAGNVAADQDKSVAELVAGDQACVTAGKCAVKELKLEMLGVTLHVIELSGWRASVQERNGTRFDQLIRLRGEKGERTTILIPATVIKADTTCSRWVKARATWEPVTITGLLPAAWNQQAFRRRDGTASMVNACRDVKGGVLMATLMWQTDPTNADAAAINEALDALGRAFPD